MTDYEGLFFTQYFWELFPKFYTVRLYGRGYENGLNGLLPLDAVNAYYPTHSGNVKIGSRNQIQLSWSSVPFAESYNVYMYFDTTSGYTGSLDFYQNTENTYYNFILPTISGGVSTNWCTWEVYPVTQGFEGASAYTYVFSYTRIGS